MKALAALAMRSRSMAGTLAGSFGLLGTALPPFSLLSGAVVGLATLRHGAAEGALVVAIAVLMTVLVGGAVLGTVSPAVGLLLGVWLPGVFVAVVLKASGDQGRAVAAAALLAFGAAAGARWAAGDIAAWWLEVLTRMAQVLREAGRVVEDAEWQAMAPWMTSAAAGGFVASTMVALLIARWWQSLLYNPGGFGTEFRQLRLPRWLAGVGVAIVVGGLVGGDRGGAPGVWFDAVTVTLVAAVFAGLAVYHQRVKAHGRSVFWLVALWFMVLRYAQGTLPLLAALGIVDAFIGLRAREPGPPTAGDAASP